MFSGDNFSASICHNVQESRKSRQTDIFQENIVPHIGNVLDFPLHASNGCDPPNNFLNRVVVLGSLPIDRKVCDGRTCLSFPKHGYGLYCARVRYLCTLRINPLVQPDFKNTFAEFAY
jgi:hypothetical protein